MKKLSVLDLAFFVVETESSPKHVAGLWYCKKPAGCPRNFGRALLEDLKTFDRPTEPFHLVIEFTGLKGPHWEECTDFSIDQHLFYHRSKKVISREEVNDLAARLHEPLMDRSKPLWEFHLIDNVRGGQFAIYVKIHHAYADGMTMTSWLEQSLRKSGKDMQLTPVWAINRPKKVQPRKKDSLLSRTIRGVQTQTRDLVLTSGGIAKLAAQQYLERIGLTRGAVALQFDAGDDTPLTGSASPERSVATANLAMKDIKRICTSTRSTVNHVALTCIDGAMHRYLEKSGCPIDHPITIQMPVSLRKEHEENSGNKLGIALVDLANPTQDPYLRLHEIGLNLRNVRNQVDSVPGSSFEQFSLLNAVAGEVIEKLQLSDMLPASGHTLVSNLPGPKKPLYLKGAKVTHHYPISTLAPGQHMNITMFSYSGILNFGIVATKDMRNLAKLARFIEEEFINLQETVDASA